MSTTATLRTATRQLLDRTDGDWRFALAEICRIADVFRARFAAAPYALAGTKRRWRRRIILDVLATELAAFYDGDRKRARVTAERHLDVDPDNPEALADAVRAAYVEACTTLIRDETRAWRVDHGLPPPLDDEEEKER